MEGEAIFNIAGVPNEEFIEEVTDSPQVKKNAIFFAMLTDGMAGDPMFGLGLGDLVGNPNTEATAIELDRRADTTLMSIVDGIRYDGIAVQRDPAQQLMSVDLNFTDLDSNAGVLVPLALSGK